MTWYQFYYILFQFSDLTSYGVEYGSADVGTRRILAGA